MVTAVNDSLSLGTWILIRTCLVYWYFMWCSEEKHIIIYLVVILSLKAFVLAWKPFWAPTWLHQQNECVPSEDSDQPGHLPSPIRVFAVHSMGSKDPRFLHAHSEDSDQSSLVAHAFCWFWHVAALLVIIRSYSGFHKSLTKWPRSKQQVPLCLCSINPLTPSGLFYCQLEEPLSLCHEKTCLQGLRPDDIQTGLFSYRD